MSRRLQLSPLVPLVLGWGACQAAPAPDPVLPHDSFVLSSRLVGPAGQGEERRINVYLPPDYRASTDVRLPLLYMPDGGIAEDFPHLTNTIDRLIAEGAIPPMLVVGIENTQRRRDLTGPTRIDTDKEIVPVVGGSAAFRAFIRDELMPAIRQRYRCTDGTAIVGESLAGLFVVETFLLEPELFDTCIAISPSLWWNDRQLLRDAPGLLSAHAGLGNTLYLTAADETDIHPHTDALAAHLAEQQPAGLRWFYEPRRDLQHHTIFRATSPTAFRRVFGR